MCFAEGSIQDYHRLSGLHYRDSRRVPAIQKNFVLKRGDEVCGDKASLKKLAKVLRILGFLTQTKVYLFWSAC